MKPNRELRINKSTKILCYFIAIMFILISTCNFIINFSKDHTVTNTKEIYQYSNKFNYDYQVNLVENEYIQNAQITDKSLVYVTDLIDTTDITLNYEYIANKNTELNYTYSIVGRLFATYTRNGEEQKVLDETEILLDETTNQIQGGEIKINEKLNLDLKEKNALLDKFEQEMSMDINAKYIITLKVNVATKVDNQDVNSNYEPQIQIDLAEKTSTITGENNIEDKQFISKEYETNIEYNVMYIFIDIVLFIIGVCLMNYARHAKATNRIRNEFKQELNKILKICGEQIVGISSKPVENGETIVNVKDFTEILKASDELFKPILYYFDAQNEEAWFSVITENVTYRYIMKR